MRRDHNYSIRMTVICECGHIITDTTETGLIVCRNPKCEQFAIFYQPLIELHPVSDDRAKV
jgi:hypothetical protein